MKKMTALFGVVLVLTLFTGCRESTSKPQNAQANLIEPCDLISKVDAQELMGEPLKDAENKENKAVGQKFCTYNAVNDDSFSLFQISITQQAFMPSDGLSPKSIYETLKANFPEGVKVDGVGADAFIAPPGLHLIKDEYYITIAVGNSDDPKNRAILKAAGEKALQNLEKFTHK